LLRYAHAGPACCTSRCKVHLNGVQGVLNPQQLQVCMREAKAGAVPACQRWLSIHAAQALQLIAQHLLVTVRVVNPINDQIFRLSSRVSTLNALLAVRCWAVRQ
jgi:hypothetical protein